VSCILPQGVEEILVNKTKSHIGNLTPQAAGKIENPPNWETHDSRTKSHDTKGNHFETLALSHLQPNRADVTQNSNAPPVPKEAWLRNLKDCHEC